MTARGEYLKSLLTSSSGRRSVRGLARLLSQRDDMPDDLESIRRTLQRYIAERGDDDDESRDVSDKYVAAISDVLGIDPQSWPPARGRRNPLRELDELREVVDHLSEKVARIERLVDDFLGPSDDPPEQPEPRALRGGRPT